MRIPDTNLRTGDIDIGGEPLWRGGVFARLGLRLDRRVSTLRAPGLRAVRIEIGIVAALWLAVMVLAFYPGILDIDGRQMLQEGISFHFNNWQSPIMSWLLGVGNQIVPGPAIPFLVTLLLYAGGYLMVASYFLATGRSLVAQLAALLLFFPIAVHALELVGTDRMLAGCCVFFFGALLQRARLNRALSLIEVLTLGALMVLLIDTRANSMLAAVPLLWLATVPLGRRIGVRSLARGLPLALLLLVLGYGAGQAFDHFYLDAYEMHEIKALEIFGIGGITYFSGRDQSRGLLGPNFLAVNRHCYTRQAVDGYLWTACPAVGKQGMADPPGKLFRAWLGAIADAPLAYLKHRVLNFLSFTRVLCQGVCAQPIIFGQNFAPPVSQRQPNPLSITIEKIGVSFETSLIGRPWLWLVELLCCAVICATRLRGGRGRIDAVFGLCLAASGLLYGIGYLAVGVASVLRYAFWIFVSGTLAPLFAWQAIAAPPEDR